MHINITAAPVVLGRFRVLPGEKMPAVDLTDVESEELARLTAKGLFEVRESFAAASAESQDEAPTSPDTPKASGRRSK